MFRTDEKPKKAFSGPAYNPWKWVKPPKMSLFTQSRFYPCVALPADHYVSRGTFSPTPHDQKRVQKLVEKYRNNELSGKQLELVKSSLESVRSGGEINLADGTKQHNGTSCPQPESEMELLNVFFFEFFCLRYETWLRKAFCKRLRVGNCPLMTFQRLVLNSGCIALP